MPDDTQTIGNDAKLKDIAEMALDVKLPDNPVGVFGIVFSNESFNT